MRFILPIAFLAALAIPAAAHADTFTITGSGAGNSGSVAVTAIPNGPGSFHYELLVANHPVVAPGGVPQQRRSAVPGLGEPGRFAGICLHRYGREHRVQRRCVLRRTRHLLRVLQGQRWRHGDRAGDVHRVGHHAQHSRAGEPAAGDRDGGAAVAGKAEGGRVGSWLLPGVVTDQRVVRASDGT